MRIKEIKIEGLFGMFNHTIPMHDDHLTIIYGENGIGKTMIFKILGWLFNLSGTSAYYLCNTPFNKISIFFKHEAAIYIYKNESNTLSIETIKYGKNSVYTINGFGEIPFGVSKNFLLTRIPNLQKISNELFRDTIEDTVLTLEEALERYEEQAVSIQFGGIEIPPTLLDFLKNAKNVQIISTERLSLIASYTSSKNRINKTTFLRKNVMLYAAEMQKLLLEIQNEYTSLSDHLKNTQNDRLQRNEINENLTDESLNSIISFIEKQRADLYKLGLSENGFSKIEIPNDPVRRALLSVNMQDIYTQLKVYERNNFLKRVQLFVEIANERRLSFKQIKLSPKYGFLVINDNGKELEPKDLSSGEQHELVLIYQLLFSIPENSLILLDEPEISLHAAWKIEFIEDMQDIIKLRGFDILLATHSAAIINGNWDLTVSLRGGHDE